MEKLTRRDLLRRAAAAGSTALLSSWFSGKAALAEGNSLLPVSGDPRQFSYFTAPEIAFVDAALDCLIPSDESGPGAREAGVAFFIDQQLAGPFGRADRWYMHGPWKQGSKEQGYQLKLTPAQLYRAGIRAVDEHCKSSFDQKTFAQLSIKDRDGLLHALDGSKLELPDAPGKDFFDMLLQNAFEGYLADPMYGGNRNFAGWKLIGFPGPRYNYVEEIGQFGKRYTRPVVGLSGRDGKIVRNI